MRPLVSILIPAYNAEEWISETIRSALAQTYLRTEIIVVDDGSTDQTFAVARRFASKKVCVVTQPNLGAASARNKALEMSQGECIQWLDADDLLAPDKVARQIGVYRELGSRRTLLSSAWGSFYYRRERAAFRPTALWQDLLPAEWLLLQLERGLHMQTATWLVSRELSTAAGPWDGRLALCPCDDGEYFCRVILASDAIRFVPEARVFYRTAGPNRLSNVSWSEAKMRGHLLGLKLYFEHFTSRVGGQRARDACVKYLQSCISEYDTENVEIARSAADLAAIYGGVLRPAHLPGKYLWIERLFGRATARRAQVKYNHWKVAILRALDRRGVVA
jgi:glycosyltransferase involved in cell wall biosynthesis